MKCIFERAMQFKQDNPNAVFSSWNEKPTEDDIAYMKFIRG
jgi:hypothetical protein